MLTKRDNNKPNEVGLKDNNGLKSFPKGKENREPRWPAWTEKGSEKQGPLNVQTQVLSSPIRIVVDPKVGTNFHNENLSQIPYVSATELEKHVS